MKCFIDILKENYNFKDEIERIAKLFNSECLYTLGHLNHKDYHSIETIFNKNLFAKWKGRFSCISINDMKNTLGIEYGYDGKPIIENEDDDILKYLEYYINIIMTFIKSEIYNNYNESQDFIMLNENIKLLLDNMSHKIVKDDEKQIFLIVPNNPEGAAAAEISSDHTGFAILRYNHRLLKGKLKEKSKILATISNEYEDILKNPPNGYKELFDKTKALCNQLCIRHDNAQNQLNVSKLKDNELEQWYDEIYQMLLLCILTYKNIEQKRVDKAQQLLNSFKE